MSRVLIARILMLVTFASRVIISIVKVLGIVISTSVFLNWWIFDFYKVGR